MANDEHIALLKRGVGFWNAWRNENFSFDPPDLLGANLTQAHLGRANLSRVVLRDANLVGAELRDADLRGADLTGADLRRADLCGVNFYRASLRDADLRDAYLREANLRDANLLGADLSLAVFRETVFVNVDLSKTKGLDTCRHMEPSVIDHRTLQRSGQLPLNFLRGVGLPDNLIEYLPSLLNQPIQFYSCFISYSSKDDEFAQRLHADLQNKGIRCWFAPHDLPIGARIRDTIDIAIRVRDKLLVILSENSIDSDWVEDEVETALEEERNSADRRTVLFPIRIDDAVRHTERAWARKLQRERHIGNFADWKDHDAYQNGLERLLRDLTIDQEAAPHAEK